MLRERPDLHTWDTSVIDSQRVPGDLSVGFSSQKVRKGPDLVFLPFFFSEGFAIDIEGVGRWSFWLDWHYPVNYLKKTFKACENIVKEASYFYFEIQFYGEC